MGKIIAIANQKGGVGKTTTAINISAGVAHLGFRVLVIDMDPQANLTSGLGYSKVYPTIYDVLVKNSEIEEVIRKTRIEGLELLPSEISLVGAEVELVDERNRETRLKRIIMPLKREYDYIFIDSPPSLGLLTLNSIVAADSVIIPIQSEFYALEGLGKLLNTVRKIQSKLNPRLTIEGVLITMFDTRLNLSHQVVEEVKKYFGDKVYNTVIPRNVKLAEAPSFGRTIFEYDPASRGAESYRNLSEEFLERNGQKGTWKGP
ncbi:ParA family protein [bacterium]|uniref:ParA family protein n=1 Tax=candidate division WOR-3 bacterium TaxID=2052148 RepID=A0A7C0ZD82_UNCW3|nr:MAG: ParA family protein [bacterium]RKZ24388.1 MAG: ParA family protein [bacterium]HDI82181.1 ParA family protein [candidate division WOR-3 bacterium]